VICLPDASEHRDASEGKQDSRAPHVLPELSRQQVQHIRETCPDHEAPLPEHPRRLAWYIERANLRIEAVLDVLTRQSGDWDDEDYREFADTRLEWTYYGESPEQQQRITKYVDYSKGFFGLHYGVDAVIEVDEATRELHLTPWPEITERLAPAIAEARAADDLQRRRDEVNRIVNTKLPRVRKLAKVRTLLEQLLALEPPHIAEQARRGIAVIQTMRGDTDSLAACTTFGQYVLKASEESIKPG
jgi:hypothetical protein